MSFEPDSFRKKFPGLGVQIHGNPLIYFDNAASSLKHSDVLERVHNYNLYEASNVHRGAHSFSQAGTESYELARVQVKKFINARSDSEVIFTRGATEGINFVARSFAGGLSPGDEILITALEHHSNIVPWQALCEEKKLNLKVVPFCRQEGFSFEKFSNLLSEKTKLVSCLWYSNSLGQRLPIEEILSHSHQAGAKVLLDGAQTPLHEEIDVQKIPVDFLVFSGHKMFAPYGIGCLYGRSEALQEMDPYQYGGSMIDRVSFSGTRYADSPQKFEAGTPYVSGAIGLGKACEIISGIGVHSWHGHLQNLRDKTLSFLSSQEDVEVYDFPAESHSSVLSFNYKGAHPSDVGSLLDKYGIAVRAGHHCTQPLMEELGVSGTVRVSFAPYNTEDEVDVFCQKIEKLKEFF